MNGLALQAIYGARVQSAGQPLTVTRPATTQGGTATTSTVYFLPQPLNAQGAAPLLLEAGLNAGEENPYDFVASGAADVRENDRITFGGLQWRVTNVNPQMFGGVQVSLHCYATREAAS